jgi:hypothetical protein
MVKAALLKRRKRRLPSNIHQGEKSVLANVIDKVRCYFKTIIKSS